MYLNRPSVDHLVVCSVKNEQALHKARDQLKEAGINFVTFEEPDIGNEMTALATEPISGDKRLFFKKYQLLKGRQNGCSNATT